MEETGGRGGEGRAVVERRGQDREWKRGEGRWGRGKVGRGGVVRGRWGGRGGKERKWSRGDRREGSGRGEGRGGESTNTSCYTVMKVPILIFFNYQIIQNCEFFTLIS